MLLILPHSLTDNKKGIDVKTQMYRQKKKPKTKVIFVTQSNTFREFYRQNAKF